MGYSLSDAAHDAAAAEQFEQALDEALHAAQGIAESFTQDYQNSTLAPAVSVRLDVGAEDQPVFVFSLLFDLDDDLDADEYPGAEVEKLQSDLRSRIASAPVDEWDWIVTTGTKAGAARR